MRIGIWIPDASESYRLALIVNLVEVGEEKKPAAFGHSAVRQQDMRRLRYLVLIYGSEVHCFCECAFTILLEYKVLQYSFLHIWPLGQQWTIAESWTLSDRSDLFSPPIYSFLLVDTNCCMSWPCLICWRPHFSHFLLPYSDSTIKRRYSSTSLLMLPFINVLCLLNGGGKNNLCFYLSWHFSATASALALADLHCHQQAAALRQEIWFVKWYTQRLEFPPPLRRSHNIYIQSYDFWCFISWCWLAIWLSIESMEKGLSLRMMSSKQAVLEV